MLAWGFESCQHPMAMANLRQCMDKTLQGIIYSPSLAVYSKKTIVSTWLSMRVWKGHGLWPNLGMSTSVAPLVNINQFIANWTPRKWNLGLRRMMSPSRSGPAWIILRPGDLEGDSSGVNGRDFFVILRFLHRLDDRWRTCTYKS